jgi:hypothetical protein
MRDVVYTSAIGIHTRLACFLLSIRSSGCRARIIVLTDDGHEFDETYQRIFTLTKTELYKFSWNSTYYGHTDVARGLLLYEWLLKHRTEIDRVFSCDAFDSFFQSDPFKTLIVQGKMTFISEGRLLSSCPVNLKWLIDCFGEEKAQSVKHNWVLCFGTIGGSINAYIKFLEFMTGNRTRWFGCRIDQGQLNYFVHSGALTRAGIDYEIQHCNQTVLSMFQCRWRRISFFHNRKIYYDISTNRKFVTAAVVHLLTSYGPVIQNYLNRCRSPET